MDTIEKLQALRQELCDIYPEKSRDERIRIDKILDRIDLLIEALSDFFNN